MGWILQVMDICESLYNAKCPMYHLSQNNLALTNCNSCKSGLICNSLKRQMVHLSENKTDGSSFLKTEQKAQDLTKATYHLWECLNLNVFHCRFMQLTSKGCNTKLRKKEKTRTEEVFHGDVFVNNFTK